MRVTHWLSIAALLALTACDGKDKGGQAPGTTAAPATKAPATEAAPATQAAPATEAAPGTAAGADGGTAAAAAGAPSEAAMTEAKSIFAQRCAACHGAEGKGDGAAAASLPVKPRNYSDQEWQKNTPDAEIAKIIVEGGAGVGKSPLMPPNPDLKDKPEVVNGLVALIRSFGKQ